MDAFTNDLKSVPDPVPVKWTDASGRRHEFTYAMPNANECHECHDNQKVLLPIGPKARNLNKEYVYADDAENRIADEQFIPRRKRQSAAEAAQVRNELRFAIRRDAINLTGFASGP